MQDLKTWKCGHCPYSINIPPEDSYSQFIDALMTIREHRFGHLVDAMTAETDEQMLALCEDEPGNRWYEDEQGVSRPCSEPVEAEDTAYVLAGVTELLKADLPRARKEQGDAL